jgi:hypothetical protein
MQPRSYQSNQRETQGSNSNAPNLLLSRANNNDQSSRNTQGMGQNYSSYNDNTLGQNQGTGQIPPRTPNTQFTKGSERFAPSVYNQSSRSVNPSVSSNPYLDSIGNQKPNLKPIRYDESQMNSQTVISLQNSNSQFQGHNPSFQEVPPSRASYMSQRGPLPSPRVMMGQTFTSQSNQNRGPNDLVSRLAENQDFRTSTIDELDSLSKEELIIRLRNSETIISELKKMIGSIRSGLSEKDETFKLSRQVQDLTNELVGLREQNFKLKNLANDELLILEKVETKEVYGKKSKVQEELEQARRMKVEYENLVKNLQHKETIITTHEKEIIEMRTVIDRTNNQLNTFRRINEEIKSGTYNSPEMDQLRKDLDNRNLMLSRKEKEFKDEQAKSSSYLKNIMDLNKQMDALKSGLNIKQNEADQLRRELSKPAQVVVERIVPQEIQQELQQLRSGQVLKEKEISSMAQNSNIANQKLKDFEIQVSNLQKNIRDLEKNSDNLNSADKREILELRAKLLDLQKLNSEKDKLIFEFESRKAANEDIKNRLSVIEAMLDERNKYITILESEKRGTVTNEEFNSLLQKAREIEGMVREREREVVKKNEIIDANEVQLKEQAMLISQYKSKLENEVQNKLSSIQDIEKSGSSEETHILRHRNQQLEAALQEKTRELQRLRDEIQNFKIPGDTEVSDGRVPAELNKIIIEQQRAKLDAYKNMIESYQKDIENLKIELDYLRKHDGNEGLFLRSQLELKNSEIGHLHRALQDMKISNAQLEASIKSLKDQLGEGYDEFTKNTMIRGSNRRVTQEINEEDYEDNEELRNQKRKRDNEIRDLKGLISKLEFELEQLTNDNNDLEKNFKGLNDELKRKKKEVEDMVLINRDLLATSENQTDLRELSDILKSFIENFNFDKNFIKRVSSLISNNNIGEALKQLLDYLSKDKNGLKKNCMSEGVQTSNSQKSESTQTEFEVGQNFNMRFASPISRANKSQFDMKEVENIQRIEDELEDLKAKYLEQVDINKKTADKNMNLHDENIAMKNQLKEVKEKKSEYKNIVKRTFKEGEDRRNSRNNFDSMSRISVDDGQQGLKMLLEEIQRLKSENSDILAKYNALRDQIVKRKKALLNELSNFVNTKNNFENSFFSEITRTSTTEVIIMPH